MRRFHALLFLLGATNALHPAQEPIQDHKDVKNTAKSINPFNKQLDEFIQKTIDDFHVAGFAVSFSDSQKTYAKGYGIAQLPDTKVTAETLFFTGSTTKSFTAASILQLIEQSSNSLSPISLRTPISSLIRDDFVLQDEYATLHATLEDALSHQTGMPRHDASYGGTGFTIKDIVRHLRYLPMTAELRQEFQYCNMMFVTLSYIIEQITGSFLGDYLRKNIWQPLGMNSTFFSLPDALEAESKGKATLARGYYYNQTSGQFLVQELMDAPENSGAGAVISNVVDYAKYLRAILHEDPHLLSAASYAELRRPRSIIDAVSRTPYTGAVQYSLGWEMGVFRNQMVYFHDGAVTGFGAKMLYVPARNWTVALMANSEVSGNAACDIVATEILERLLHVPAEEKFDWVRKYRDKEAMMKERWRDARGLSWPDAPPPEHALPTTLELEMYAGTYNHPAYQNITLRVEDSPYWWLRDPEKVLHTDVFNKTWKHTLDFEHVSGDYFVARLHGPSFSPSPDMEFQFLKAEFRIGSNGVTSQLGIAFEEQMGKELIWLERII